MLGMKPRHGFPARAAVAALVMASCTPPPPASTAQAAQSDRRKLPLLEMYADIKTKQFVDLTHAFAPGIPHWKGFPDEKREMIYGFDQGSMGKGFFAELFTHVGQWGTHVDPPAHFAKGLRTVDQIDLKEMILPL